MAAFDKFVDFVLYGFLNVYQHKGPFWLGDGHVPFELNVVFKVLHRFVDVR